jgi:glycosyltransferase involved in cell wall biosynthesis
LDHSLSIVVPVHNLEGSLGRQIARLLEILPELTARFEVVIVDDASTDQTADVASELAREYPQIRVVAQPKRLGQIAAARIGSQRAKGEVVLTQDEIDGMNSAELRRLWNQRRDAALITSRASSMASSAGVFEGPLLDRLSVWGQSLKGAEQSQSRASDKVDISASRISQVDLGRADSSHEPKKAPPVRNFLKHLRAITLGE